MKKLFALLFLTFTAANSQTALLSNVWAAAETVPVKGPEVNKAALGLDLMGGDTNGVTVFANRTNDHLVVSVQGSPMEKKSLQVANSTGQSVLKMNNRRENTFMLDVSTLRPGLYFIEIRSGGHIYRKKWVRQ